jgi:hypothetical protein
MFALGVVPVLVVVKIAPLKAVVAADEIALGLVMNAIVPSASSAQAASTTKNIRELKILDR